MIFGLNCNQNNENFANFWVNFPNRTRFFMEIEELEMKKISTRHNLNEEKDEKERIEGENQENLEELKENIEIFNSEDYKSSFSLTFPHGLIVKFFSNGDVYQEYKDNKVRKGDQEVSRLITGKGSIIKKLANGSIEILFANGNISHSQENGIWITTNNKVNYFIFNEFLFFFLVNCN